MKILWFTFGAAFVLGFMVWIFAAFVDFSLGCPPPPFAHKCLMQKGGVLPPYR